VQMATQTVRITTIVPGSAAARAGLHAADVVTAIDGVSISTPAQLTTIVQNHRAGDHLQVSIVRGGQHLTITATLDTA